MFGQNTSFGGNSSFGAANNAPKPAFGGFGTTTAQPTAGGFGGGGLFGQNTTNTSTGGGKRMRTYLMILVTVSNCIICQGKRNHCRLVVTVM